MSDKSQDQPQIAETEGAKAKTIVLGKKTMFFNKPVPSDDSQIVETADIVSSNGTLVGTLVGRLQTQDGSAIDGSKGIHPVFTAISKNAEPVSHAGDNPHKVDQLPLPKPVIYLYLSDGRVLGFLGTEDEGRVIKFQNHVELKDKKENKHVVEELTRKHRAQPTPLRLQDLIGVELKIA